MDENNPRGSLRRRRRRRRRRIIQVESGKRRNLSYRAETPAIRVNRSFVRFCFLPPVR